MPRPVITYHDATVTFTHRQGTGACEAELTREYGTETVLGVIESYGWHEDSRLPAACPECGHVYTSDERAAIEAMLERKLVGATAARGLGARRIA